MRQNRINGTPLCGAFAHTPSPPPTHTLNAGFLLPRVSAAPYSCGPIRKCQKQHCSARKLSWWQLVEATSRLSCPVRRLRCGQLDVENGLQKTNQSLWCSQLTTFKLFAPLPTHPLPLYPPSSSTMPCTDVSFTRLGISPANASSVKHPTCRNR